jgi:hypothetical protein
VTLAARVRRLASLSAPAPAGRRSRVGSIRGRPGRRLGGVETRADLFVYRLLDNRLRGEPDDSPFALELHQRRREALEDAFAQNDDIRVVDWGDTKDEESHELVEVVLAAGATAVFKHVVVPGAKLLGEKLIEVGVEKTASEFVKAIFSRLRPKQEAREVSDFSITLPDGAQVQVMAPHQGSAITVTSGGATVTIEASPAGE